MAKEPRPPLPPWCPSADQAAFAIAAALHVSHPTVGALVLSSIELVQAAADRWQPRMPDRWTSLEKLASAVGLEAGAESIRQQWSTHAAAPKDGPGRVTVELDPA